jgi:CRP/FNR family cyclic AMP-dependent transcriptional regulator
METIEPLLAQHPLFTGLEPKYLQLIVGCASNVRFDPGHYIGRDGEEVNEFFLIRHGSVALETYSPVKGPITIHTLHAGDVLGWSWLVWPYRSHFDARAVELVRGIRLDGKCLRQKCDQDPLLEREMLKRFVPIIVDRLEAVTMQLLDVYASGS